MGQIQIRIFPDGKIESKTVNIKGKKCLKYIDVVQKLTNAYVVDSDFTKEYYEKENAEQVVMNSERIELK